MHNNKKELETIRRFWNDPCVRFLFVLVIILSTVTGTYACVKYCKTNSS